MTHTRAHRRRFGLLVGALAAATLAGLSFEVLRPGHHVHLGDGGRHHHHFFVGAHEHDRHAHPERDHDHGHGNGGHDVAGDLRRSNLHHHEPADHGAGGSAAEPGRGESSEQRPDRDHGPELINGFTLEAPRAPAGPGAPLLAAATATPPAAAPLPARPECLPAGARAPPAPSIV